MGRDSLYGEEGPVRTDMHCHNCVKTFIAELDFSINGQHVVECPHCSHEHYRTIKDGKITEDRWNSQATQIRVSPNSVWKSSVLKAQTSTVSAFIRERWLNRSDYQP